MAARSHSGMAGGEKVEMHDRTVKDHHLITSTCNDHPILF